jgi:hypothetical protein
VRNRLGPKWPCHLNPNSGPNQKRPDSRISGCDGLLQQSLEFITESRLQQLLAGNGW